MISGMQHCDVIGIIGCGCAGCIGFVPGSVGYMYDGLDILIRKSFSDGWNLFVSSVAVHCWLALSGAIYKFSLYFFWAEE